MDSEKLVELRGSLSPVVPELHRTRHKWVRHTEPASLSASRRIFVLASPELGWEGKTQTFISDDLRLNKLIPSGEGSSLSPLYMKVNFGAHFNIKMHPNPN